MDKVHTLLLDLLLSPIFHLNLTDLTQASATSQLSRISNFPLQKHIGLKTMHRSTQPNIPR